MTEGMKLSTKTATPLLVLHDAVETNQNGALQLLAEQYRRRLERIFLKNAKKNIQVDLPTILYYNQAEARVRALYADAT